MPNFRVVRALLASVGGLLLFDRSLTTLAFNRSPAPAIMDAQQEATKASQNIRRLTELQLRRRYPYMETGTLKGFLDKVEADCQRLLTEQETEHQRTKSHINFFTLPAELRNQIYELALVNTYMGTSPQGDESKEHHISSYWYRRPGLLSASQRVRNEILPMYYATTIRWFTSAEVAPPNLTAPTYSLSERKLDAYLCAIGPEQARMIKEIKIVFNAMILPRGVPGGMALDRLIALENLADEKVVERILMAFGLLCYGVPRKAWKIETGVPLAADGTILSAAQRPSAQPEVPGSTEARRIFNPSNAAREAQLRQAPTSCASVTSLAPPRTPPWSASMDTGRIRRRRNGGDPSAVLPSAKPTLEPPSLGS